MLAPPARDFRRVPGDVVQASQARMRWRLQPLPSLQRRDCGCQRSMCRRTCSALRSPSACPRCSTCGADHLMSVSFGSDGSNHDFGFLVHLAPDYSMEASTTGKHLLLTENLVSSTHGAATALGQMCLLQGRCRVAGSHQAIRSCLRWAGSMGGGGAAVGAAAAWQPDGRPLLRAHCRTLLPRSRPPGALRSQRSLAAAPFRDKVRRIASGRPLHSQTAGLLDVIAPLAFVPSRSVAESVHTWVTLGHCSRIAHQSAQA